MDSNWIQAIRLRQLGQQLHLGDFKMAGSLLFASGDRLDFSVSGTAVPTGAFSLAIVIKPSALTGLRTLIESKSSSRDTLVFQTNGTAPAVTVPSGLLTADTSTTRGLIVSTSVWQLIGISKAAGSAPVRFHRVDLSTGAGYHGGAVGAPNVPNATVGPWGIGWYRNNASWYYEGVIAAAGVWNRALSDAEFDSLTSWIGLMHQYPRALWRLDGSAPFRDATGRNLTGSTPTGTRHSTDAPTSFWPVSTTGASYRGYGDGNWPGSGWTPYSQRGVWNTPIDSSVDVVHPNSAAIVADVLALGTIGNLVAGVADTRRDFAHPLYFARSDDPEYTIEFTNATSPLEGTRIRIPDAARPAGGDDGHLAVVQPPDANGEAWEYDFWRVSSKPAGGGTLRASNGGRTRVDRSGLGSNATASHFGLAAGTIRGAELSAGQINHALFVSVMGGARPDETGFGYGTQISASGDGTYVSPSENGDAYPPDTTEWASFDNLPPMGARFWLDMTATEIDALSVPAWKKTILKALARYGAYFGDTGGPGFGLQFESGQSYTSFGVADPLVSYAAANGVTNYLDPSDANGLDVWVYDVRAGVDWASKLKVVLPPSYPVIVGGDVPVSWWRLGESSGTTAADAMGANPGQYSARGITYGVGSLLPSRPRETAVALDGVDGDISIADAGSLDLTSQFSLEAWIKPSSLPTDDEITAIVSKELSYGLMFFNDQLTLVTFNTSVEDRYELRARSGLISVGSAYHVVGTYDGATMRLYVNGAEVASMAQTIPPAVTSTEVTIGSYDGGANFFHGVVDEVALYNQPLSPQAVKRHYLAGTAL